MEEWLDIYNGRGELTGKRIRRGDKMEPGEYVRVIQASVFNSKNEMLIQQRHKDKRGWPKLWDVSAEGALQAGENIYEGVHRELLEELGIDHDFTNDIPKISVFYGMGFTDVFYLTMDLDPKGLKLQEDEVQDARWASREEVLNLLETGQFVPYHRSWIEYLFDRQIYAWNFT